MAENAFIDDLNACLLRALPGFQQVLGADRMTGGASQQTWRLKVKWNDTQQVICLRRSVGAVDAGSMTPAIEAQLLQAAGKAAVPVPEVFHVLSPEDGLGEGFFMSWLEGEALGGRITHSRQFADVRPCLARQCGEVLARIHAIDCRANGLERQLQQASPEQLVRETWEQYRAFNTPQPMIDFTARWLLDHLPRPARTTLVHGDFRNGNLMVSPTEGIVGVLDWELAAIGDPMRDLGWLCTNSWRFGRPDLPVGGFGAVAELLAAYENTSGIQVDLEALHFWMVFGSFWWSVCCLILAQSYRSGENASVERPAIGRRSSEAQADCVAMVIPGMAQLPAAIQADNQLPRHDELLESVSRFLATEAAPALSGSQGYLAKVAANSVAIASREHQMGPALAEAEAARLRALPQPMDSRVALAQALRGELDINMPGLAEHLRSTVQGQLAIDQPGYRVIFSRSVYTMWSAFLAGRDDAAPLAAGGFDSFHFCDNPRDADLCGQLVLSGKKRATASCSLIYELLSEPLPEAGGLAVVTDSAGEALCVIRTTSAQAVPFNEVDAQFAAAEGEGDGSLAQWREVHWAYYTRELAPWGREPEPDMPVLCEQFEVLYP